MTTETKPTAYDAVQAARCSRIIRQIRADAELFTVALAIQEMINDGTTEREVVERLSRAINEIT